MRHLNITSAKGLERLEYLILPFKITDVEVNNELIDKLAALAKLTYEGEERESIKSDLQRIMNFVDKLESVDTAGVEPLVYLTDEVQTLRADDVKRTIEKKEALERAPQKDSDYFKVPKVLSK